ncbi:hypothetical protein KUTeg_013693 [Tegillarca granosa]|uniref:Nuclear export mediator factor NEMF n=1 Tax=Tegillarca granosa TaxID=220873 RepID=A0ABQ9EUT3_TEGGR|nr:hypothetical protein KUTeg_013693 [Tegillarca granosa]
MNVYYRFCGMRVLNVYDVDNKTYLIRLGKPDDKAVILIESGIRIHSTEYDWPKSMAPSGFSMKLRKHIKGRRLESVLQLGVDRIVDLQFGSSEAAYHVILELYDRGNIILTDFEYTILNILRPRTDTCQDVRFAVRETYPVANAKQHDVPTDERLREIILAGKVGDPLKKILIPHLDYGPAMIEHCLIHAGFIDNVKIGKGFSLTDDMDKLKMAIEEAERLFELIQFTPCQAVDEFFSKMESQKLDMKTLQMEKSALKKLENIKKDHEKRIDSLQKEQSIDIQKGHLIEMNLSSVDHAILIVNSAIANQIDWAEIWDLIKEAQSTGDPVALAIKSIKLDTNQITMFLRDPYTDSDEDSEDTIPPMKVDIDLSHSAYANSRKYFEKKKQAAKKEQKTIDASTKALKSAEKKTKETLKEVATAASINKARKTYWFEKFLWFISSENFLVIGGRDQQQNELIVKRYLKPGDIYVHADLHGASSVVIKNQNPGDPIPPKTLNEAGTMAICNSAAWDAKVITSAWWVHHDQVSKTAPSGEYLTTGSFMIRDGDSDNESDNSSDSDNEEDKNDNKLQTLKEDNEDELCSENQVKVEGSQVEKQEENNSSEDDNAAFPDTSISLQHVKGDKLGKELECQQNKEGKEMRKARKNQLQQKDEMEDDEDKVSWLNQETPNDRLQETPTDRLNDPDDRGTDQTEDKTQSCSRVDKQESVEEESKNTNRNEQQQPAKRGQKGKRKKMRDKYADQDEEERQLRMEILAAVTQKTEPDDDINEDTTQQTDDVDVLDSLTGLPVAEDELLFAIPVVAPYNALTNYKYKVKLLPGSTKRGKGAKTAVNMFQYEKTASVREKDLLRHLKDTDLSRNIPGKVKVSAPNLHKKKGK